MRGVPTFGAFIDGFQEGALLQAEWPSRHLFPSR